jgi:hypothetical protein
MSRLTVIALLAATACGTSLTPQQERFANAPPPSAVVTRALVMGGTPLCGAPGLEYCQDDAHASHAAYMVRDQGGVNPGFCNNCHVGWTLDWFGDEFDPQGNRRPAFAVPTPSNPNPPRPRFNGWSMTGQAVSGVYSCSNVACHAMPEHTYSFNVQGSAGEAVATTVAIPAVVRDTQVWGTTGATCTACHDLAPGTGAWHQGHANGSFANANECTLCHSNVRGTVASGLTIVDTALHGNGVAEVQARFRSSCFNCH